MTNSISNIESTILTDSKIYEYITNYTSSFMSLYNCDFIKLFNKEEDISNIQKFNSNNVKKFYFIKDTSLNIEYFTTIDTPVINELISMSYRFLTGLGLTDLSVNLNSMLNLDVIKSTLEYLDIPYKISTLKNNENYFEIAYKENLLTYGIKSTGENYIEVSSLINLNTLIDVMKEQECFVPMNELDVFVIQNDDYVFTSQIIDDLRLSEFSVETNYLSTSEETEELINHLNPKFILTIENNDYLIIEDFITKEKTKVKTSDLIDYLNTNI